MRQIKLSHAVSTLVDDDDYEMLSGYTWQLDHGYARTWVYLGKINGKYTQKSYWMHRLITSTPDNMQTDHINGDRLDNRRSNLRVCTAQENRRNSGLNSRNTSGITGVFYKTSRDKWQAKITVDYKVISLGHFKDKDDAVKARKIAEAKYFKEFARS